MSKALEILHVKELVHQNKGSVFADSLSIAKNFEKQHGHVLRDIENLKKDLSNFGEMFREAKYLDEYNREQKMIEMTRDGFSLLAMKFTGKKALQWQLQYINAFNTMEQIITQKQNQEWQIARTKGISIRKDLSDTQYAKEKVLIFASSIAVAKITSDFKNGTLLTRKNQ